MAAFKALPALVIFLSAFLLFLVEPMTAKRLLPMLGGSSAVWITCLVFFQTALLAGYLYAHLLGRRLRPRAQALTHSILLVFSLAVLAATTRWNAAADTAHPFLSTIGLLSVLIGLPFIALAATTPLLQSWHARSGISPGWRFFALSNLASLLALIAYPWLVEPNLALRTQRLAWAIAFVIFAAACTAVAWRAGKMRPGATSVAPTEANDSLSFERASARGVRILWLLLPAASSMLLCAVTAHLSQNIAAVPLLWIVPLAAYLLSFILTFAGPRWYARSYALRALALALATVGYLLVNPQRGQPLLISLPVYAGALFVFGYVCHGELYRLRPPAAETTRFYLLLSLGSALGAIFIGVCATMLYRANFDLALCVLVLAALIAVATWDIGPLIRVFWLTATCAMAWVLVANVRALDHDTISQLRSFYGSLRVTEIFAIPGPGIQRTLYNGTIQHGTQVFNDEMRHQPTTYYAPDSGIGIALRYCCQGHARHIGAVGLGTGTIATYLQPGDAITFYEINPLVERLARARFTYLHDCRGTVNVEIGDARVRMEHEPPQNYDVIALDAFSGDAIPVHLITAQAIELYQRHLKPGGILAFHISSQYVDLAPVLAAEARHAGMTALGIHSLADDEVYEFQADWVLMSTNADFFRQSDVAIASHPLTLRADLPLWTDDRNSLLPLVKWTGFETAGPSGSDSNQPAPDGGR